MQTLRSRVSRLGPLSDDDLRALARDLAAMEAFPPSPDGLRFVPGLGWRGAAGGVEPAGEGWEPFEVLADQERASSGTYRAGALLFYAATALEPSAAGLPFRYEEPAELAKRWDGLRRELAGCLSPAWADRPLRPDQVLSRLGRGLERAAMPSAVKAQAAVTLLGAAMALAVTGLLVTTMPADGPERRPAASARARAHISGLLPFLKPRKEPAFPVAGERYLDAVTAARALLKPGEASGDLRHIVIDGESHLFARGQLVSSERRGYARPDGSTALQTSRGWTIRRADGTVARLPPLETGWSFARWHLLLDSKGRLWAAGGKWTDHAGLWVSDGAGWKRLDDKPPFNGARRFGGIEEDETGAVWVAFSSAETPAAVFDDGGWRVLSAGAASWAKGAAIAPLGHGEALTGGDEDWRGEGDGRLLWFGPGGRRAGFGGPDGLQRGVERIAVDRAGGRLYLVNDDHCLTVVDAQGFRRRYAKNDGMPEDLQDAAVDALGRVWLFAYEGVKVLPPGTL